MENEKRQPAQPINPLDAKSPAFILWLSLSADLSFIILHIIFKTTTLLNTTLYSVKRDHGYSEFFQYIKYLWIILLLLYILRKTGFFGYLSWTALFLYFLLDDALEVHENMGSLIAGKLDFTPPFNLRLQDIGEVAVYAIFGPLLMLGIFWAYKRGSQNFKGISIDLLLLVAILAFLGIVVDNVEIALDHGVFLEEAAGLLDDGGEMIVVSVMLWYIFRLALHNGKIEDFFHQRLGWFQRTSKI